MTLRRLPEHMKHRYGSMHGFRSQKRRECGAALDALRELALASAFLPGDCCKKVHEARKTLAEARQQLSVKEWGR